MSHELESGSGAADAPMCPPLVFDAAAAAAHGYRFKRVDNTHGSNDQHRHHQHHQHHQHSHAHRRGSDEVPRGSGGSSASASVSHGDAHDAAERGDDGDEHRVGHDDDDDDGGDEQHVGGRRFLKIDLHTHILPKTWPDLSEKYGYGGFVRLEHHEPRRARMLIDGKFFREIEENCWSCEARVPQCNATGVDVQVLSTVPVMFSYWAKPEHCLDLSRYLNDHVAHEVSMNPKRFLGLGTLPMQAPDLAVRELRRCVQDLGLCGVQIGSHINSWNLDSPELFPVWEEAERIGAAVFVHPWDMMGAQQMTKYWLPWLVGMPAETSRAICSMIFGGVFERFPRLRVCFAHGGGSFPMTIGRVSHGFHCRPDLCAVDNPHDPREYVGRFWVDSLVHDSDVLQYLVKFAGDRRVVLGSDYPFPLGEDVPGKLIEDAPFLSDEQRARLLGLNALEFLGVPLERFADE